jgi:hypothetical protein
LAEEIGCRHLSVVIDPIIGAFETFFFTVTGKRPRFIVSLDPPKFVDNRLITKKFQIVEHVHSMYQSEPRRISSGRLGSAKHSSSHSHGLVIFFCPTAALD